VATTTLPPFDGNRRANAGEFVDEVKIMARRLHLLPPFLDGVVTEQAYFRWLARRADARLLRDRKRFSNGAMGAAYRKAIHEAVLASGGRDDYTGEELDWMHKAAIEQERQEAKDRERARDEALRQIAREVMNPKRDEQASDIAPDAGPEQEPRIER